MLLLLLWLAKLSNYTDHLSLTPPHTPGNMLVLVLAYLALPENGGVKVEANEQVSENYGRTYVSGTDELGDFKVGTFARIENRTGNITFTGTVTISEVEFLKLKGGDVVVTGFDNSNTLGGANATDSKLPTQKAVKDFITNNLGPYINKPYSTNPVPRALVELTDSGKISEDQIPPLRPFQVFTVANQAERVAIEGALAGDIAIQQDGPTSFILNNDNDSLFVAFAVDTTLQFTHRLTSSLVASLVVRSSQPNIDKVLFIRSTLLMVVLDMSPLLLSLFLVVTHKQVVFQQTMQPLLMVKLLLFTIELSQWCCWW